MEKEIDKCTILNRRNYLRMKHEAIKHGIEFVCRICKRPFNIGDKVYRFRSPFVYYCENCYKIARVDVPDDVLDHNDLVFIESGEQCLQMDT